MTVAERRVAAGRLTSEARQELYAQIERIQLAQKVDTESEATLQSRVRDIARDLDDHVLVIEVETHVLMEWSAEKAALALKIEAIGKRWKEYQAQVVALVDRLGRDDHPVSVDEVCTDGQRSIFAGTWPLRVTGEM